MWQVKDTFSGSPIIEEMLIHAVLVSCVAEPNEAQKSMLKGP